MNKKGFTLVELIAVLIVLSIILLIAVPKVMNMIEVSKMKAFEVSANKLLDAAIKEYTKDNLEKEYTILDGAFINNQLTNIVIPYNVTINNDSISSSFYTSYVTGYNKEGGTYTALSQDNVWTKQ